MGRKVIVFISLLFLFVFGFSQSSRPISLEKAIPKSQNHIQYIDHKYFKLGYVEKHEQAEWVAYILTKTMVENNNVKRHSSFAQDKKVITQSASNKDYKNSGYDKGHLCPAGDMNWDAKAMKATFLLSNISPQDPSFNRGIWKKLEERARDWAVENDSIIIITGPVLKEIITSIGENQVSVPCYFYKIIIDISPPDYKAIGFIIENTSSNLDLRNFSFSIREIETFTNLNFFHKYDKDEFIERLETSINLSDWNLKNEKNRKETKKSR